MNLITRLQITWRFWEFLRGFRNEHDAIQIFTTNRWDVDDTFILMGRGRQAWTASNFAADYLGRQSGSRAEYRRSVRVS